MEGQRQRLSVPFSECVGDFYLKPVIPCRQPGILSGKVGGLCIVPFLVEGKQAVPVFQVRTELVAAPEK